MLNTNQFDERTITGVVAPFEWDEDDEELVFAVVIITDEGDDYLVDDTDIGEELLELVDSRVKVTGWVEEDEEGELMITVRGYKVLPSPVMV